MCLTVIHGTVKERSRASAAAAQPAHRLGHLAQRDELDPRRQPPRRGAALGKQQAAEAETRRLAQAQVDAPDPTHLAPRF